MAKNVWLGLFTRVKLFMATPNNFAPKLTQHFDDFFYVFFPLLLRTKTRARKKEKRYFKI